MDDHLYSGWPTTMWLEVRTFENKKIENKMPGSVGLLTKCCGAKSTGPHGVRHDTLHGLAKSF